MKNKPVSTSMSLQYLRTDVVKGAIIYGLGDLIATLILDEFSVYRLLGMVFIGATLYAFEIPNVFQWIERKTMHLLGTKRTLTKTALAMGYFNPIWIARHLLFIKIFSLHFDQIGWDLMKVAWWSFLFNIPISILANYLIQNKIYLSWRFMASAVFSALMAIYYALSETIFL